MILATGFHAAEQPYARVIRGIAGQLLSERWAAGMTAHASTAMHGFPNLFVINGPNAGLRHNSAIYMIETQIDYVLGALRHRADLAGSALTVSAAAEEKAMYSMISASHSLESLLASLNVRSNVR